MAKYIDKSAIVAEIERRTKEHHSGYLVCLKDMLSFIDTLEVKEEPVSEDLEEAASRYAKEEYNRKSPATLPDRCRGCYSPLMYAFKAGAEWQKEQMIDKACKWLKSYRQDTPDGTGYMAGIVNDKTIKEFKKMVGK